MKLALLIGVSEYDTQADLPGCKNDVMAVKQIIDATKKYDDKLVIDSHTNSNSVKQKVSSFFDKHINSEDKIEEFFFYFSGHGTYQSEEFYYILSDYEGSKLNRTTYKNSEIDELIKSLNPELTIKVIDACESGVRYVKDNGEYGVKKMLDRTTDNFSNCYFMFSSQFNESSYALDTLSYFTESFINSILLHDTDTIRYRDIIDFIADDFSGKNVQQTPFYITQGNNTEIFGSFSKEVKNELEKRIVSREEIKEIQKADQELSLVEKVINDAAYYCESVDEIKTTFKDIEEQINTTSVLEELSDIYNTHAEFNTVYYHDVKGIDKVADFISEDSDDLFVNIIYTVKTFKVKIDNWATQISRTIGNHVEPQYKEEKRRVVDYYEITEDSLPYNYIELDLNPKYPNLMKYNCRMIFAFSKKELLIFYSYNIYKEVRWGEFEPEKINWRRSTNLLFKEKTEIESHIDEILMGFKELVINNLKSQFSITTEKTSLIDSKK